MPRSISEGGLSKAELHTIIRRLPAYSRDVLRHLNSAASDAEVASEARWRQHNIDLAKRNEIKTVVGHAEAAYANATMHGKPKKVCDALARAAAEAREELAIFNRQVEERVERENIRQSKSEGGLLDGVHKALAQHRHASFAEKAVELPKGESKTALAKVRNTIAEKTKALENVDLAPLTYDEAMAAVDRELNRLESEGLPDTYGVTRYAKMFGENRTQGTIGWRNDFVASEFLPSGFKLVAWALKDTLRAKIEADVKARIERSEIAPMSIADRKKVKAQLTVEVLDLEHIECRLIAALQAEGDESVSRRPGTDPLAVLGVEVVPSDTKTADTAGSLASAVTFEVEGQKLPVSRLWTDGDPTPSLPLKR